MPTATEVDNRPVAVGKWPRIRSSTRRESTGHHSDLYSRTNHHQHHHHHRRNNESSSTSNSQPDQLCTNENCFRPYASVASLYTDILLQPDLLQEFYGDRYLSSSNPLLELCLDGDYANKCYDSPDGKSAHVLPPLLSHCSSVYELESKDSKDFVDCLGQHLRQTGCDINVQDPQGSTALHLLINGCSKDNFQAVLSSTQLLLDHSSLDLTLVDSSGNTALTRLQVLLKRGMYHESYHLAKCILLNKKGNVMVNHLSQADRTLLSHSVFYGDICLDLTRLLLNHGAQVLPARYSIERNRSAFTWFLQGVMGRTSLQHHSQTLLLLCQCMAVQPEQMRDHVLTTMVHLGHSANVMGPLFIKLKEAMSPYWLQPQPLLQLCRNTIRTSLGPKNIAKGSQQLKLPQSMLQYLNLN